MNHIKEFILHPRSDATVVSRTPDMGRILLRPEMDAIALGFNVNIRRISDTSIDLIPPLNRDDLPILGKALVDLANGLDDTSPKATYRIVK